MKKILAMILALTMCLALAACGSSDASTDDTTASATEAAEETSGTEEESSAEEASDAEEETGTEEASATLTTVTEGVLTMSTNAAFPPYEMTTDDGGFEGIDVEIATAIAEKLGLELQIDDMDFDSALLAVQQGKSDIVMAGVSVTDDRLLVMDFSDSYATGVQVVIVPEDTEVTIDTLGDYVIGTQRATTGNIYCTDDYGEDHVIAYDNGVTAVRALMNGQVDCVVIDSAPAQEFVAANAGLTILDTEYVSEEYAIGMAKGNTALVDAVNSALEELTADGTVQSIIDKYITAE
ncbi:MAG: transporter substrate-binding domain-containing protein [Lachnospiraceae bacterium]|nr:transporter substrate-binding domain-containing protein [Lachnospiraceae bacterium]